MRRIATLAAGAALAVLGTAALAQTQGSGGPGAQPPADAAARPRPQMTRADMESLVDARIAAIQAGLKLTPEQQRHWPAVEQAIRGMAAARIDRFERRREAWARGGRPQADRPDFMERLERRSQRVDERAERIKTLAAAMRPLWTSLDDRQKRLLPVLTRPVGGFGGGRRWREGRMGHHGMMRHHHRMERGGGMGQGRGSEGAPRQQ
jgi:zinc resistance-associated protein